MIPQRTSYPGLTEVVIKEPHQSLYSLAFGPPAGTGLDGYVQALSCGPNSKSEYEQQAAHPLRIKQATDEDYPDAVTSHLRV